MIRNAARTALVLLFALGCLTAQNPATYEVNDLTAGTGSMGTGNFDLVGGNLIGFEVGGTPGEIVLLLASPNPPVMPAPMIGGVPLAIDLASAIVLVDGIQNPSLVIGGAGNFILPVQLPPVLPAGLDIWTQAGLIDPVFLTPRLAPGIVLHVPSPCGTSAPSFVQLWSSGGSALNTGHYANGFTVTVNDPQPKFVAPGHLFTPSEWAKIRLHPMGMPQTATIDYTWSGGDEVGYFRDRLTLDGSTPGIDRIFFVARNTTNTPNFVDWDGNAFSNETSLAGAAGSIQRLCVTDTGDLIGNDFFGNVYLWDKQNAYQQTLLFTFSNTPGSIPWGSSLDTALGKIGYDPVSGLILFPVRNDAVSMSGQLYGFDLAGNRMLADQNLMQQAPTGFNSYRYGVTVDLTSPNCRVLVHGGRDAGPYFIARFTNGLQQKTVNQIPGDSNGGWLGALVGNEFWTNTNTQSYGLVQRTLPADW